MPGGIRPEISPVPQTGDGLKLCSGSPSGFWPDFSGPTDRRRIETDADSEDTEFEIISPVPQTGDGLKR